MSTVIDERVVSMQFDNKHFEKNVQTSLGTIDKLKQSLKFKNASKGLESIQAAANRIDFSKMEALACSAGFSFRDVWIKAISGIEYKLASMGRKFVSELTIDPIKTGFKEYETQINAVQTILANTESKGSTLEDVNKALDELNKYADQTIYNFTEMTRNIGTFTAAGVELDTSVNAIKGIANLAAVSGSTSQQASTAMYQLSQALSSGTVKLMDWNSVVNAGMGGQVFQDALKETARVHGIAIDEMIESEGSFRETLSEGWLTSDILTETLEKFTMATEGLTEAEIAANREKLESIGYTDEQIDGIFKLGNTATNAATKVKTFSQMWEVLKESAQSGWSQTWKLIVGDFEEAKNLLTPLTDFLTGVINGFSEARNKLLGGALDFSSPWEAILKKLGGKGLTKVTKVASKIQDITDKLEYYQEVVDKVWHGDYKNSDTGRFDLLEDDGYNHKVVQELVNLGNEHKLTIEDIKEAYEKYGLTLDDNISTTENVHKALDDLTYAQLKHAGLTEDEIDLYMGLRKEADRLGISVSDLADRMSKKDGRTLLIESFSNAGKGLVAVFKALKDAWLEIFPPMSSARLYTIIDAINKFSQHLVVSDETADKLKRTLKGVFAVLDIALTLVMGPTRIILDAIMKTLQLFDIDILSITASIGDVIVKIRDWIDANNPLVALFTLVGKGIKFVVNAIKDWIASLRDSDSIPGDFIQGLVNGFKVGVSKVVNAVKNIGVRLLEGLKNILGIHSPSTKAMEIAEYFIQGLVNGFQFGWGLIKRICSALYDLIVENISAEKVKTLFTNIAGAIKGALLGIGGGFGTIFDTLVKGIKIGIPKFVDGVKGVFKTIKENLSGGIKKGVEEGATEGTEAGADSLWSRFKKWFTDIKNKIVSFDWGSLVPLALSGALVVLAVKMGNLLSGLGGLFSGFDDLVEAITKTTKKFNKLMSNTSFLIMAEAMLKIAQAILMIAGAMIVLSVLSPAKLWSTFGVVALLTAIMGGIMILLTKVGKVEKGQELSALAQGGSIMFLATSLILFATAMVILGKIDSGAVGQAVGLILLLSGIIAALIALSKFKGNSKHMAKLGTMMKRIAGALLLMAGVCWILGKLERGSVERGVIAIVAFGALTAAMTLLAKKIRPQHFEKLKTMMSTISLSLLALVATFYIFNKLDRGAVERGVIAITAFGVLVGAMVGIAKVAKPTDIKKLQALLLTVSGTLLAIALACVLFNRTTWEGLDVVAAVVGMFAALIGSVILLSKGVRDKDLIKFGATIALFAGTMLLLAATFKILSTITWDEFAIAAAGIGLMSALMIALMGITKIGGKSGLSKVEARIAGLGGALLLVALAFKILSTITWGEMGTATVAIIALGGIIVGLIAATKLAKDELPKVGRMMNGLGVALLMMSLAFKILGSMDWDDLGTATVAIAILGGIIVGLIAATKLAKDELPAIGRMMMGLGVALLTMSISLMILSAIKWDKIWPGLAAIGAFCGMIAVIMLASKNVGDLKGTMIGLAVAIAVMSASLAILSLIDSEAIIKAVVSLSVVMGMFALMVFTAKGLDASGFKSLLALTAILVVIAASLAVLSKLNPEGLIPATIAMSGVMLALVGISYLLGKLGSQMSNIMKGEAALAILVVITGVVAAILYMMKDIDPGQSIAMAGILSVFMLALVGIAALLGLLGNMLGQIVLGQVALTLMVAIAALAGLILSKLKDIDPGQAIAMVGVLTAFLGGMLVIAALCGALSLIAGPALVGAAALAAIIVILTGAIWLSSFMLPSLGDNLSKFATSLEGFINTIKSLDSNLLSNMAILVGAIALLTAASFVNSLTSFGDTIRKWFGGDDALTSLLKKFANAFIEFSDAITGNIDTGAVTAAANVFSSIANFQNIDSEKLKKAAEAIEKLSGKLAGLAGADYSGVIALGDAVAPIRSFSAINVEGLAAATTQVERLVELALGMNGIEFSGMSSFGDALVDVANTGITAFTDTFANATEEVLVAIDGMIMNVVGGIEGYYESFHGAGAYLVDGFAAGITSKTFAARAKATAMANAALRAAEKALDEHSPSKEFYRVGAFAGQGFVNAFGDYESVSYNAGADIANSARDGLSNAISQVQDIINSDMDVQPVISPVLDLSDVESGARSINNMFGMQPSLGVMSNINSINSMMRNRQNGVTSDDVMTAVEELGRIFSESSSGNTYNVNGVTYDDGSNVASAVETLFRAAKIQRRI